MKARNVVIGAGRIQKSHPEGNSGRQARKKQSNEYFQGLPEAGDGPTGNVDGIIDQSGKKAPYGGRSKSWAANSGKLGDSDPQETDQPSWVNTWSPLQEGPNGAGATRDENYGDQRPRTQSRQEERFEFCNPEFQDVANEGDWTSWKWNKNV